jgi:hypothetical protein
MDAKRRERNASASMYADLLAKALANWDAEMNAGALFDYVLACRVEMLRSTPSPGTDAYLTLAKEIAYDRSLIKLCATHGIDAYAVDFAHPSEERSRLERELTSHGVILTELSRERLA